MQDFIRITDFQNFQHRAPVKEVFLTAGETVKEDSVLLQAREACLFGLQKDEATDISVATQLVTFILAHQSRRLRR